MYTYVSTITINLKGLTESVDKLLKETGEDINNILKECGIPVLYDPGGLAHLRVTVTSDLPLSKAALDTMYPVFKEECIKQFGEDAVVGEFWEEDGKEIEHASPGNVEG